MPLSNLGITLAYPHIAGKYSGKLLIVASGHTVWSDLERYKFGEREDAIRFPGDVMAVNDVGMHLPCELTHWYSNDWKMLPLWARARRPRLVKVHQKKIELHSCFSEIGHKWPWPGHGTSSLNAVYTGLALGYEEIILAGVPLDNGGHYFDPPWVRTNFENEVPTRDGQLRYWKVAKTQVFDGRVKSLSGRTKELLGTP